MGCENSLVATNQSSRQVTLDRLSRVPSGEELGRFQNYLDAKKVVDRLLEGGIPPKALSIVGEGLESVERITARYGYGRAAMSSAMTGSWIGLFSGLLFASFGQVVSLSPLLAGAVIGAGVGMIIGMVLYTSQRTNRPTFRSVQQIIAESYRVIVDESLGGKAKRVLSEAQGD
jgi:hypothetical protein